MLLCLLMYLYAAFTKGKYLIVYNNAFCSVFVIYMYG